MKGVECPSAASLIMVLFINKIDIFLGFFFVCSAFRRVRVKVGL